MNEAEQRAEQKPAPVHYGEDGVVGEREEAARNHIGQVPVDDYSVTPDGTLFFLNFVAATFVAVTLLVPFERVGERHGRVFLIAAATAGIAIAAGSLAA